MKIDYILTSENGKQPFQAYDGDAGYDLYVSKEAIIKPHSFQDIDVGIAIAMPPGIWGRITGRSSTMRKYGLQTVEGIIDEGFRGPLFVGVWNHTEKTVEIEIGMRLAQIIFHNVIKLDWQKTETLPPSLRGQHGFGSSGI